MIQRHCDGPGCETLAPYDRDEDWLEVHDAESEDLLGVFCTRWCLAKWAVDADTEAIHYA